MLLCVWVLAIIEGLAIVVLMREIGRIHLRLGPPQAARVTQDGPEIGSLAPQITAEDITGQTWRFAEHGTRPRMLIFTLEECLACRDLAPSITPFARAQPDIDVLLVRESESRPTRVDGPVHVLVGQQIAAAFAVRRFPYALLFDAEGVLRAKGIVNTLGHLESLLPRLPSHAGASLPN
jgi:methylamine dehydrogenase accessory protein MauD